jgi:endoglucanase
MLELAPPRPGSLVWLLLVSVVGCDAGSSSGPRTPTPTPTSTGSVPSACEPEVPDAVSYLEPNLPASIPTASVGRDGIADLSRGINLGNALDAPVGADWGVELTEAHFSTIAEAGFDHVRIPARFNAHAQATAPFTIDEAFFAKMDFALDQAEAHGLAAIVDLHHFEELMASPAAETPRFVAIWEQIADRYRDRPASVKYELLNEPTGALDNQWNSIYPQGLAAIRERDPSRTVLLDSTFWAAARALSNLELVDDPALVATFHMYEPILFTHQAAPWMSPEYQTSGLVFPGPPCEPVTPVAAAQAVPWVNSWFQNYNRDALASNAGGPKSVEEIFAHVDAFVARTGRAVYLGEFAVIDVADPNSRERWLRLVRDHADARDIPWAYWDDGGMNRAYYPERGEWLPNIRRALLD